MAFGLQPIIADLRPTVDAGSAAPEEEADHSQEEVAQ
jgi:hypothetical protein